MRWVVLTSLEDFSNYALKFEKIGKRQTSFGKWYWVGDKNYKGNFLGYFNKEFFNLYDKKWAALMYYVDIRDIVLYEENKNYIMREETQITIDYYLLVIW